MRTLQELAESTQKAFQTIEANADEALARPDVEGANRARLIALKRRVLSVHRAAERLAEEIPEIRPFFGDK